MNLPSEPFDLTQLQTLAGLAMAVYVLVTALRTIWPRVPAKTAALALGVALSLLVALLTGSRTPDALLLAVLNGILSALLAAGESLAVATLMRGPQAQTVHRPWWAEWS